MGKRDKDKDKDKKKKKDKEKSSKKDKDKSRHKSDRRPSTDDETEAGTRHDRHGSPTSSKSRRDKREELKRRRSPDSIEHRSKRGHHEIDKGKDEEEPEIKIEPKGGSADLSLSINETNKLRLQLGLKPLDVGGNKGGDSAPSGANGNNEDEDNGEGETKKKEPQHLPPKNIGEEAAADKMRDKLKLVRETREIAKKLSAVKGLGEVDQNADMEASDWVSKMREKEKQKEMAKKRAKLLEEMDDEFGVSELIGAEFQGKKQPPQPSYTATDLTGIKIQHKDDTFKEGRDIVLTLKDSAVLDEDNGDVLVNVNMIDDEHASRNVQLKKGLPGYIPYEEEFDEYGNPKTRSLLYKYDEEIEGLKRDSFVLGDKGTFDVGQLEKEREESKKILEQRAIKLEMPKPVIASEYYTSEEMVQFKKRKRRKKKDKFKSDNLLPLGNEEDTRDHGSRRRQHVTENENDALENKNESVDKESMEVDVKPDPVLLDEQDSTIDTALARTRRLLTGGSSSVDRKMGAAFVATMVAAEPRIKEEPGDSNEGMIVLNTTAEFCRNVGEEEFVSEDKEVNKEFKMEEEEKEEEREDDSNSDDDMEGEDGSHCGGWTEVDPTTDSDKTKKSTNDIDVLELDVVMSTGVAAALQMASKKGFVDTEDAKEKKKDGSSKVIIEGLGVRDWEYERDRGREKDRERDHGREMAFAEKSGYKPAVNIEYVDNMGRLLTPKEAFRHMSHKFHGKTSGKRKSEKRLKRLQEEFLLNQASTVDTPLQTVELFRKRQENSQSAYVVLSGAQQQHALNMTELAKRK